MVFIAATYVNMFAHVQPDMQFSHRTTRDGDKTFLVALAVYAQKTFVQEQIGDKQPRKFTYAQTATVQHLYYAMVTYALWFAHVYDGEYAVYLLDGEHLRQMAANLWRFEQFGRILLYVFLQNQKTVKRTHAAENACNTARSDAAVAQCAGKQVKISDRSRSIVYAVVAIVVEQFLQVAAIGIQRVVAERTFETQIPDIFADDAGRHASEIVYRGHDK